MTLNLNGIAEAEIIKKAQEIQNRNYKENEEKKRTELDKVMQSLTGKFFKTLDYTDDKKSFYRIFYDSWRDNQVKVESWYYYHDNHYRISVNTWYSDNRALYDEEITEIEFMQAVSWWMKKVGIHQILTMESDH